MGLNLQGASPHWPLCHLEDERKGRGIGESPKKEGGVPSQSSQRTGHATAHTRSLNFIDHDMATDSPKRSRPTLPDDGFDETKFKTDAQERLDSAHCLKGRLRGVPLGYSATQWKVGPFPATYPPSQVLAAIAAAYPGTESASDLIVPARGQPGCFWVRFTALSATFCRAAGVGTLDALPVSTRIAPRRSRVNRTARIDSVYLSFKSYRAAYAFVEERGPGFGLLEERLTDPSIAAWALHAVHLADQPRPGAYVICLALDVFTSAADASTQLPLDWVLANIRDKARDDAEEYTPLLTLHPPRQALDDFALSRAVRLTLLEDETLGPEDIWTTIFRLFPGLARDDASFLFLTSDAARRLPTRLRYTLTDRYDRRTATLLFGSISADVPGLEFRVLEKGDHLKGTIGLKNQEEAALFAAAFQELHPPLPAHVKAPSCRLLLADTLRRLIICKVCDRAHNGALCPPRDRPFCSKCQVSGHAYADGWCPAHPKLEDLMQVHFPAPVALPPPEVTTVAESTKVALKERFARRVKARISFQDA